jgi:membrane protease subunit HflK
VTLRRLYIDTMQEILSRTPSIVLDDKLQGIVPYLPLGTLPNAPAPAPAPPPPPRTGSSP